jgi:carbamoyl-phosphate synthase large subunit
VARQYVALGFTLVATPHTAEAFQAMNLPVEILEQPVQAVRSGQIQLVINTPTRGKISTRQGFKLRRAAAEYKVPCLTSLDTAKALALAIKSINRVPPQPQSLFRDSNNSLTQWLSS